MVLLIKKIINWYYYVNNELADPRVKDYPMMSSPFPLITIVIFYLYFVRSWGPRLMQNRKPFNIDKFIIAFNISQILMCAFIVYKFLTVCAFRFSWLCEPIDYGYGWFPMMQVFYSWIYHLIKILDLLDTIFFVLRKKNSQISFLHLYHHTGMVILTWVGVKFLAGGHGLFVGFANCVVHTCMYFYYLMSIWDEKYKRSIWWKKYITQLQIAQFLFLAITFSSLLIQPSCTYPKVVVSVLLPQIIFIFIMFCDFYYKAYIVKKTPQKNIHEETTKGNNATKDEERRDGQENNAEKFTYTLRERQRAENKRI